MIQKFTNISLAGAATLAAAAATNGSAVDISDFTGLAKIILDASATGASGQTLDVKIQHSDLEDSGFTDAGDDFKFAQVTHSAASVQTLLVPIDGLKKYIRAVSTLAGATPTVARSVTLIGRKANP